MDLDNTDRKLLNSIQTDFPLVVEPYAELGQRLDTSGDTIIERITQLKKAGVIRLIGPVLEPRSLGYRTTLVAMEVREAQLARAEDVIVGHAGVSHGYIREHNFNVWFTLAVSPADDVDGEMERLARLAGAAAAFSLPTVRVFKIGAYFDMDGDGQKPRVTPRHHALTHQVVLSATERLVINELQEDLPLVSTPFTAMASRAGIDVAQFLEVCCSLQRKGVMRRFSASINHRQAGFSANAMTCWITPADKVEATGKKLASLKEVSHCYERRTNPLWPYNLFAMIHGKSRETCKEIAARASGETGLVSPVLLYSTRELKKTRVKYQV